MDEEIQEPEEVKKPGASGEIISRLVGWLAYTIVMALFLFPVIVSTWQWLGVSLTLGSFAQQLNAIKNKL